MSDAYVTALRMLAGRELSAAQLRQRLGRRRLEPADIDEAVDRLRAEGAIDDDRVARAIARVSTGVKRRGRLRVRREIEQAGIASATARRVVDEAFAEIDADALLDAALAKRLRGSARIVDDAQFARLYRFLINQGFEADKVAAALRKRRKGKEDD